MPLSPVVLLLGEIADERLNITELCAQFGWSVKRVKSLDEVPQADRRSVVAGFADASDDAGLTLADAVRRFPRAAWVACCRFGSPGARQDFDRGVAYHLVHRPFDASEIRQCLHFIRAAAGPRFHQCFSMPSREAAPEYDATAQATLPAVMPSTPRSAVPLLLPQRHQGINASGPSRRQISRQQSGAH